MRQVDLPQATQICFLLRMAFWDPWQPPFPYYGLNSQGTYCKAPECLVPASLTDITPLSTFDVESGARSPIQIQCGTTQFRLQDPLKPGNFTWNANYLRIAFIDDFFFKKELVRTRHTAGVECLCVCVCACVCVCVCVSMNCNFRNPDGDKMMTNK